ncbi:MAG: hypothetical protein ACXV7G_10225 [Halobacteriota archaeon]
MIKDIPANISYHEEHDWAVKIEACKDKADAEQTQQQRIQQAKQAGYSYVDVVDYHGVHIWEGEKPIPNNTELVEYRFIELWLPMDFRSAIMFMIQRFGGLHNKIKKPSFCCNLYDRGIT